MWTKFVNWVNKVFLNPWYIVSVVTAFIAMISYFQIGSYRADKNGLNWFWTLNGIVFTVVAIYFMYKALKNSGGNTGYKQ
jgi:putative effector of murein hydrolase